MACNSSIPEAIQVITGSCEKYPELKVTGLFDPAIDNASRAALKEEMLNDSNN